MVVLHIEGDWRCVPWKNNVVEAHYYIESHNFGISSGDPWGIKAIADDNKFQHMKNSQTKIDVKVSMYTFWCMTLTFCGYHTRTPILL